MFYEKKSAGVLVLTVIAVLLASCSGGDTSVETAEVTLAEPATTTEAPTTTIEAPSTTTTTIDTAEWLAERVAKIESMVADRNSGDFDAWRAHFIAERPTIFASVVVDEAEDLEWQRSFMAANEIWTITGECTNVGMVSVICPFTLKNEFHGPAGIFFTVPQLIFDFDEDLQISLMLAHDWEHAQDPAVFNAAFDAWLAEAHPVVHTSFGQRVEGQDGLPNPDDMPTALGYVAEFIERSDEYLVG